MQLLRQWFFETKTPMKNTLTIHECTETGDMILDLTAVVTELEWYPGDELDIQVQGDVIVIKNLTKHPELF